MSSFDKRGGEVQLPLPDLVHDMEPPDLPFEGYCVQDRSTLVDAMERFRKSDRLVVDLETTGVEPFHGDRMCGIAVRDEGGICWYLPFRHQGEEAAGNLHMSCLEDLRILFEEKDYTFVGHNYKFDIEFLHADGFPIPDRIRDTMLAAHLMDENEESFNLETLADKYLSGFDAKAGSRYLTEVLSSHGLGKGGMWKMPPGAVAPYAMFDVFLTDELDQFYEPHLRRWDLYDLWLEVCYYSVVIARSEIWGLKLDLDRVRQYRQQAIDRSQQAKERLQGYAGYPLNPRSSKQLCSLLGTNSSRAEILEQIIEERDSDVAKAILEFRGWDKMRGSYYDPFLERVDDEGFLHANLKIHGTVSGRLSCTNPNLQAIPRKDEDVDDEKERIKKVKDVFVAPEGWVFMAADYSQAEIRLATHYTGSDKVRDVLLSGADIHSAAAEDMGIPRHAAKRLNYAVIYGIGVSGLAETLNIPMDEAEEYLNQYHDQWPGFKWLYSKAEAIAKKRGYIRLWTGRVRHYNRSWVEEHKASSNLIQGGVAEMLRIAQTRVDRQLRSEGVRQVLQVHDSNLVLLPEDRWQDLAPEVLRIMEDFDFWVPMDVDVKIGKRWGTAEEKEIQYDKAS